MSVCLGVCATILLACTLRMTTTFGMHRAVVRHSFVSDNTSRQTNRCQQMASGTLAHAVEDWVVAGGSGAEMLDA